MATNDSKRYFWFKLKKDFFQQHQIKVLKSLPNGRLIGWIYLELLAESTSHNGELRYSETIPYDISSLASVIDESREDLEKALEILDKLELIDVLEDQTIYMREVSKLLGSETGQTIRKREQKQQEGKNYPDITPTLPKKYPRDKSIDTRDKSKEKDNTIVLSKEKNTTMATKRFVKPSISEIEEYVEVKGYEIIAQHFYDYYEANGWKVGKNPMKDWKATIRNWARNNKNWSKSVKKNIPDFEAPNYTSTINDADKKLLEKVFGND